jgi:DNA gyrase/topoisomerase IV subunit A
VSDILDTTKGVIRDLLEMEEQSRPDWPTIGEICDSEIARINETGLGAKINGLPYQFLEDYDIRRKDSRYGDHQREQVREMLGL